MSIRHRLRRLDHEAREVRQAEVATAPMTDDERADWMQYWLNQDFDTLSPQDQHRVETIRYVLDRARRRAEAAG
jgi:hypothetical protein